MPLKCICPLLLFCCVARGQANFISAAPDERGFIVRDSNRTFVPWGLNYGNHGRLIEDFWDKEWETVVSDFRTMKSMGASVARIHLQLNKFMDAPDQPNAHSLAQLHRLIDLAETTGVYLDLTGLACYRPADVPRWYDSLSEQQRWAVQSRFWEAVAKQGAASRTIFCYDLMNEPIVPGGRRKPGKWYSGKLLGGFDYVQFITLDQAGRPREQIAKHWIQTLSRGVRKSDQRHLITVGLLPWVPNWGHLSGFIPETVAPQLDFVSVHIYPESNKVPDALATLKKFSVGKPVIIEETFPLTCSIQDVRRFILESRPTACGWMGHYDGQPTEELQALKRSGKITISQSLWLDWLDLFKDMAPQMTGRPIKIPAGKDAP